MIVVTYKDHALNRLTLREISLDWVKEAILRPNHKKKQVEGKRGNEEVILVWKKIPGMRAENLKVVYKPCDNCLVVITIHPLSNKKMIKELKKLVKERSKR